MTNSEISPVAFQQQLHKAPTGIEGLDQITGGGLPNGRPTLICGGPGCGKTIFAIEFLVHGAIQYDEPGVFLSFEETTEELAQNVASLGFDLEALVKERRITLDFVRVERGEIQETGEYDLEGLFIRLGFAIAAIGAKRVVLDTIESLFSGLSNVSILRAELRRLFRWLKDKGVTVIITGERGAETFTRQGLEEYVSDCVILLDHRINGEISTRRLRVVKYRGSAHGTNEYPFLIGENGILVLPITSIGLNHQASEERISSGIARLDEMLDGRGYYQGSSILVTGTSGTGKTSLATHLVHTACQRGETCLYFAMEESREQIVRNMRSIGIDLEPAIASNKLFFYSVRPTLYGLEMHLAMMYKRVLEVRPKVVVVDPISSLLSVGTVNEVHAMLTRLVDFLKTEGITSFFTDLTDADRLSLEATGLGVSSVMDVWLLLRDIETSGERNRGLYVIKSRGMAHSNQIREFLITDHGVNLLDVYLGPEGVLTGSARLSQKVREEMAEAGFKQEVERQRLLTERNRKSLEAQIIALQAEIAAEEAQLNAVLSQEERRERQKRTNQMEMARIRRAEGDKDKGDASNGSVEGKEHE